LAQINLSERQSISNYQSKAVDILGWEKQSCVNFVDVYSSKSVVIMKKRFSSASDISQVLAAASDGNFDSIFGEESERWWDFVRERLDLGADELMIRLELEDPDFRRWFLWLLFRVEEDSRALALEEVLVPDYEAKPEAAIEIPQGREQVPYFILS